MPWVIFIAALILIALICYIVTVLEKHCYNFAAFCTGIVGIIMCFISFILLIGALNWTAYVANIESRRAYVIEKGAVYTEMLDKYQTTLMPQDLTASDSYLELYSNILDYNQEVRNAKKWKDSWWAEAIFYDPAYVGVKEIPINGGG